VHGTGYTVSEREEEEGDDDDEDDEDDREDDDDWWLASGHGNMTVSVVIMVEQRA